VTARIETPDDWRDPVPDSGEPPDTGDPIGSAQE
jgi:hypothetical protein